MNKNIINEISQLLNISENQIKNTMILLEDKNTIPFIARYRKEKTGNLNEDQIRSINEIYIYKINLLNKKEDIIRLITEKDLMTEKLKNEIMKCTKLIEVEDLYRPFKEKKKTKATEAIANNLEGLAKYILTFPNENIDLKVNEYLSEKVLTKEDAIKGAGYIIAEMISDNANYRKWIRNFVFNNGLIISKIKKDCNDENKIYEMYYDYKERIQNIKPHRILALNRGEKEKVISVKIEADENIIIKYLESKIIKNNNSNVIKYVSSFILDSYKRLIFPSIEREIRSELTETASDLSIILFSKNLEKLLLTPPMKEKIVLGFDPAFRTGCKLAVIDKTGKMIDISVIYPHEPRNEKEKSKEHIINLINKYNIDIIAIGNGTASRESEFFIVDVIKSSKKEVKYIIVNEAGASVYSASKNAQTEFPDLHVEERSAISIGRRLQDPLAELVKIDTKSIGIGQYQHDVSETKLNESLTFIVEKVVNNVGININTASKELLKFISGMNKNAIEKIINFRNSKGKIDSRKEIKSLLNSKVYEQAIGFVRILDGSNPLDKTDVHPESYNIAIDLLNYLNSSIDDLGTKELENKLNQIDIEKTKEKFNIDYYTLEDIIKSLKKPLRDPRDEIEKPILKKDVLEIKDLKRGMKLQGTVRNVVDFGVFIDIGLHNDGLAHISKLTSHYIKHPLEVVNVGDIVNCYVDEINLEKNKVNLSLLNPKEE